MFQHTTVMPGASSVTWDTLDAWVRERFQGLPQQFREEEVTEFLDRRTSARRAVGDSPPGYRNGYGKPRRLTLGAGRSPSGGRGGRGVDARCERRVLPLCARRTRAVSGLIPELHRPGLAASAFDLALWGLLGEAAPLSASIVARLLVRWQADWELWATRRLDTPAVGDLWVDGVYVKAGLEREQTALLLAVAGLREGRTGVVAVTPGARASVESGAAGLRDLRSHGMPCPRLVIGDGHLGSWGGLSQVYPEAAEQRYWTHGLLNVLDKLPRTQRATAKPLVTAIAYAPTRTAAEKRRAAFEAWCRQHGDDQAAAVSRDWERCVPCCRFPREHWGHRRTANIVESPMAARQGARRRLCCLPGDSPDRAPDEHLNNDGKANGVGRQRPHTEREGIHTVRGLPPTHATAAEESRPLLPPP